MCERRGRTTSVAQGEGGGAYGTREGGELEGLRSSGLRSGGEEGLWLEGGGVGERVGRLGMAVG